MGSAVIVIEWWNIYIYDYFCVYLHKRVCQVALRTMCVCFVLRRFTGVITHPQRGCVCPSVDAGRCVYNGCHVFLFHSDLWDLSWEQWRGMNIRQRTHWDREQDKQALLSRKVIHMDTTVQIFKQGFWENTEKASHLHDGATADLNYLNIFRTLNTSVFIWTVKGAASFEFVSLYLIFYIITKYILLKNKNI